MEEIDNKAEKRKDADIMKKYKAVFSDIDGTLLNSKHQIPENTTKKDIKVDICSKCHPFWTGNLRQETAGGRADRFKKKYGLA